LPSVLFDQRTRVWCCPPPIQLQFYSGVSSVGVVPPSGSQFRACCQISLDFLRQPIVKSRTAVVEDSFPPQFFFERSFLHIVRASTSAEPPRGPFLWGSGGVSLLWNELFLMSPFPRFLRFFVLTRRFLSTALGRSFYPYFSRLPRGTRGISPSHHFSRWAFFHYVVSFILTLFLFLTLPICQKNFSKNFIDPPLFLLLDPFNEWLSLI